MATQRYCFMSSYGGSVVNATTPVASIRRIGVGIDTARYGHRVTFLREDKQPAAKPVTITESSLGYQQLKECLERLHRKNPETQFHVHVDAAGQYATNLVLFLQSLSLPLTVSIGEPARNKNYQRTFSPKRTCDDTESHAMARFGVVEQPPATPSVPEDFYVLREIVGRLQGNIRDTTRVINRLHNLLARVFPELATIVDDLSAVSILTLLQKYPTPPRIAAARLDSLKRIPYLRHDKATSIHAAAKQTIGSLSGELAESLVRELVENVLRCVRAEEKLEKLLERAYRALPPSGHVHVESITGIGLVTAAVLVAKIVSIDRFQAPKNLVGYFGVFPEENTSGVDRWGNKIPPGTQHMCAKGSDVVRRYLWNSAKSAITHNPAIRALYKRQRASGQRGDVALGHCMRKLLHLVFAVWSSNTPFSATHYPWEATQPSHTEQVVEQPPQEAQVPQQEKAAGHKREILPRKSVVTATNCNLEEQSASVNQLHSKDKSGSVDYGFLRQQLTMKQILSHLGYWDQLRGRGAERRGPCPLHCSQHASSRSFAVNLDKNVFSCFSPSCQKAGNVLDFWAAIHHLPIYEAALNLAEVFNLALHPGTEKRSP